MSENWEHVKQFGRFIREKGKTILQAALGGHANSSARAETLGAIIGVARPGPAHLGIDSTACLAVAHQLHSLTKHIMPGVGLDTGGSLTS